MVTLGRHTPTNAEEADNNNLQRDYQQSENHGDNVSITTVSSSASQENQDSDGNENLTTDGVLVAPGSSGSRELQPPEPPTYGAVNVQNSSDVFIGNKTVYQGPVTIKQVVYRGHPNSDGTTILQNGEVKKITESGEIDDDGYKSGCDNLSFDGVVVDNEIKKHYGANSYPQSRIQNQTQLQKGIIYLQNISPRHKVMIIVWILLVFIALILLVVFLTKTIKSTKNSIRETSNEHDFDVPWADVNVTVTDVGKLRIKPRSEWNARPPVNASTPLVLPVPYVIIHHTATDTCSTQAACNYQCVQIQRFHMDSNGWWDIGYNFLVGGDGFAYEGRGWYGQGAHLYGYNTQSIGIAFIGTFITITPPEKQLLAALQVIEEAVNLNIITKDYKVFAAFQLQSGTLSPGKNLYEKMKLWPHWAEKP